jgi:hypothetical protein
LRTPKSLNWTLGGLGSSLRSGFAILEFSPQGAPLVGQLCNLGKRYPEHSRRICELTGVAIELRCKYGPRTFLLIDKLATGREANKSKQQRKTPRVLCAIDLLELRGPETVLFYRVREKKIRS